LWEVGSVAVLQSAVAEVARRAVAARKAGCSTYREGSALFKLDEGGMCARFVRQCCEVAAGLPAFGLWFAAPTARQMEDKLRAAAKAVASPEPGDIIAMNNQSYPSGHIGIFLGDGLVAENTSSSVRGTPRAPGPKISRLAEIGASKVSGYYRPFEGRRPMLLAQAADGSWRVVECRLKVERGVCRVDLRPVAEALGFVVTDHLADQGKVYVRRKA
jgi:hypothetical protein